MARHEPPHTQPRILDVKLLCRDAAQVEGSFALATMPRLASGLQGVPDTAVTWKALGSRRPVTGGEPENWLHLQAQALVPLQCQRCLGPMSLPVDADVRLAMVWSEEEIPSLPQRFEGLVVGEGLSDLYELVEEELLLAIPLAPRHPEGECALRQTVESDEVADDDERENPFAVLAKIKGSSS